MLHPAEKALPNWVARPLGSPGCEYYAGGEACTHQINELGICATGLCPVTVEVTDKGRRALEQIKEGAK